jgi:hypothetical protein
LYSSFISQKASIYSPLLYDSIYAYGLALAKTFNQSGGQVRPETYRNGTQIAINGKTTFQGRLFLHLKILYFWQNK